MEVQVLDAPREVRWRCVEGPPKWLGTDITFQLSEQDNHCFHILTKAQEERAPHDLKIDNWN